jgi:hypothetical protein
MDGRKPSRLVTCSQRIAERDPVTARFGPTFSPSSSARACEGGVAESRTAAGRLLTATLE